MGSSVLPTSRMSLHFLMSELALMFHQAVELSDGMGVDPLGIVIKDDGVGSALIVLNFALPLSNQYERKYA